jgi:hypothetical protein
LAEDREARYSPTFERIGFTDSQGVSRMLTGTKSGKGFVFTPRDADEERALDLFGLRSAPKKSKTEKE